MDPKITVVITVLDVLVDDDGHILCHFNTKCRFGISVHLSASSYCYSMRYIMRDVHTPLYYKSVVMFGVISQGNIIGM